MFPTSPLVFRSGYSFDWITNGPSLEPAPLGPSLEPAPGPSLEPVWGPSLGPKPGPSLEPVWESPNAIPGLCVIRRDHGDFEKQQRQALLRINRAVARVIGGRFS
jgi:hypothetical protein